MPEAIALLPLINKKKQELFVPALIGMIKIINEESLSTIN